MKTGKHSQGFTIVEVMIVLAVTALLITSALVFISGKQQTTEFNQSVNDIQSRVSEIMSYVENGYYSRTNSFTCTENAGKPRPVAGPGNLGTNDECTFIGRAIKFTTSSDFNVYSLIGLRNRAGTDVNVINLSQAHPLVLSNNVENKTLQYGLKVRPNGMRYSTDTSLPSLSTGVVAFVTSFGQVTNGGSSTAKLYAINGPLLSSSSASAISTMDGSANFIEATAVSICFDGDTDLYGILTIGSNNRQLNASLSIENKTANPPECS